MIIEIYSFEKKRKYSFPNLLPGFLFYVLNEPRAHSKENKQFVLVAFAIILRNFNINSKEE